jgi:hypothetical protein
MKVVHTGTIHAAEPGTRRAFAVFPSVLPLAGGSLLACYRVGSTKDSEDESIELRRSHDMGLTWSEPEAPLPEYSEPGQRYSLRLTYVMQAVSGELLASAMAINRTAYPGKPLFNDATQGCLPMRILISKSSDRGHTWGPWDRVDVPVDIGPPSLTSNLLRLAGGRLALSIESNKHYLDESPWLQKVTYLFSDDGGCTWGDPVVVSQDATGRIDNWDQRAAVNPDGSIVSFTWVWDSEAGRYLNIGRRHSFDGGRTWTEPDDLGFADQPSHPAVFPDGRIVLAWVDRFGSQSIRARLARSSRDAFAAETEVVLYEAAAPAARSQSGGTAGTLDEMVRWTYGLPYATTLPNGEALVAYYAGGADGTSIRYARLAL